MPSGRSGITSWTQSTRCSGLVESVRNCTAIAHSPEAKGKPVVDTFSLRGFSAAYAAISKACPPK